MPFIVHTAGNLCKTLIISYECEITETVISISELTKHRSYISTNRNASYLHLLLAFIDFQFAIVNTPLPRKCISLQETVSCHGDPDLSICVCLLDKSHAVKSDSRFSSLLLQANDTLKSNQEI